MPHPVLVIEDEPSLNRAIAALLEGLDQPVHSFLSAEQAWAQSTLWLHRCQCVFVDVSLPGASGLDFVFRLRERMPDLPVVLMSGLRGIWSLDGLEPICYLTKPFGLGELQEALSWSQSGEPCSLEPVSKRMEIC